MAGGMEINPVANFNVNGDKLSQSWVRWHRRFELYATGKAITDKKQKKALLLHCAGLEEEEGDDDYAKCVATLKKYFSSKVNFSVERYNFRSIRQSDTETDGPTKCMLSDCYLCDCFVKYYVTLLTVLTNWGSCDLSVRICDTRMSHKYVT